MNFGHGELGFGAWPRAKSMPVAEYCTVFSASTPMALDAFPTTVLASCAEAVQTSNAASASPVRHFLNISHRLSRGRSVTRVTRQRYSERAIVAGQREASEQPSCRWAREGTMSISAMTDYKPQQLDKKWQQQWTSSNAFEVEVDAKRPKYYTLEMFAYPSGHAHVGHVRNYIIGDIMARMKRMRGFNVLHPFGWDAFGLPAENAAIKTGTHPETSTLDNIAHMKGQLQRLGLSYAWQREIATCLPEYYKFNQWIFLKMFERGLAYRKRSTVNWCPSCQTVLANEQVENGACWGCGTTVVTRELEQWFFRITAYADQLLDGLDTLTAWPEKVLLMQRNWIGRSEGARLKFPVVPLSGKPSPDDAIEIFTTRIDTIYGATFVLLAPEHTLVERFASQSADPKAMQERVARFHALDREARLTGAI